MTSGLSVPVWQVIPEARLEALGAALHLLIRECSWCRIFLGTKSSGAAEGGVSHGLCGECAARLRRVA